MLRHTTKTGPWIFLLAMGVAVSFGTLSPASIDVRAETASVPYINGLVNPAYANLPLSSREVPQKRSEKAAVFQVGPDKYAAISFASPMFTDVDGKWLPIDQSGRKEGDSYIFDRLAEGIDIIFDLAKPQYTLMQNGQGFTVAFSASATGRVMDDRSVEYVLADGATLTWTVNGNHVHKEILVEKYGIAHNIAFTITPIGNLHLQKADEVLSLVNDEKKEMFLFTEPFLAKVDGAKLDNAITLKKSGHQYRYIFDESTLSLPYIIDPSSGPNDPGTIVDDASTGTITWSDPSYAAVSDFQPASAYTSGSSTTSHYLKATNFGFSIPSGATIDGIVVEVQRNCTNCAWRIATDNIVRLVKGDTIQGDDKADTVTSWGGSYEYKTYGTSSDVWGLSFTDADINATTFGFALSAFLTGSGMGTSAFVDHIRITVYYTESGGGGGGDPVPAISFTSGGIALAGFLWQRRRTKPVLHSSSS